jgi:uncharacterized protein (DUF1501 family)
MTPRRFVLVLLRGGLDGLSAVAPYGDPRLAALRPGLVVPEPGREGGLLDLGGFWGLHPALANLHAMYRDGEMLAVHAVAGPYRTRSHFDALIQMETGADRATSGWLNRAAAALPAGAGFAAALALGAIQPLVLHGDARVGGWAARRSRPPSERFHADLAELWSEDRSVGHAVAERRFADGALAGMDDGHRTPFTQMAGVAGRMLAAADGPRIAELELEGWDTHARQAGNLPRSLSQLDEGLAALKAGLGDAWASTVVLVMTEFGRTVRQNGTHGTDHGTGGVAFVLGGGVAGGRVRGDWPGLADLDLLEGRDLQPTTDTRALAKGLIGPHLGLDGATLEMVFPGSGPVAVAGLLRH